MKKNNPVLSTIISVTIILACISSAFFIPGFVLKYMAERNNYQMNSVETDMHILAQNNADLNPLSTYEQMRILGNSDNIAILSDAEIAALFGPNTNRPLTDAYDIKKLISNLYKNKLCPSDYGKDNFYNWNLNTVYLRETTLNSFTTSYESVSMINVSSTEVFNLLVSENGTVLYFLYMGSEGNFEDLPPLSRNYSALEIVNDRPCTYVELPTDTEITYSYPGITFPNEKNEIGILIIGTSNSYTASEIPNLYNDNFDRFEFYYVFRSCSVGSDGMMSYLYCIIPYNLS